MGVYSPHSNQQLSKNIKGLMILFLFSLVFILECIYLFDEAQLFEEYAQAFYAIITIFTAIITLTMHILKRKTSFKYMKYFEDIVQASKQLITYNEIMGHSIQ